jgi:predicted metalloendopeptidase
MDNKKDFYSIINDQWIDTTEIPNDNKSWDFFQILTDNINNNLKEIIEDNNTPISIIYNQFCETKNKIQSLDKINKLVEKINKIDNVYELFNYITNLNLLVGVSLPITILVQPSYNNSKLCIVHLVSNGFGLPNKEYYFLNNKEEIRKDYLNLINNYSKLFNININSNNIFKLEKLLANQTYNSEQERIPELNNNEIMIKEFKLLYPNLNFYDDILKNFDDTLPINITNPKYIKLVNELIPIISINVWKDYFIFRILCEFNNLCPIEIENCYFNFYYNKISGVKTMKPTWKRAIELLESIMGESLGKIYVDKYFNQESKNKVIEMIQLIKNELGEYLKNNDWMGSETKKKALEKLNNMKMKIGFPDIYEKDYTKLNINKNNSLFDNVLLCRKYNLELLYKYLYSEPNKNKWYMNPHTVNAYYSPNSNEIVFPAGILQKPFFSLEQDMGSNFGGIGMIIGHEITHGFDDQGSKFDANGNLYNWWTMNDIKKYNELTKKVIKQYNNYEINGQKINGELTLGENIADIGGLNLSINAYMKYLKIDPKEKNNIEKLFINFANIWKSKMRDEEIKLKILTDPHSPPIFRVNGTLRNIDKFYETFKIDDNNILYISPNDRIKIWSI